MKFILFCSIHFSTLACYASNQSDCLSGNGKACRLVMDEVGRSSNKSGALTFFQQACSTDKLKVSCEVISIEKESTLKKTMELYTPRSGIFVINGTNLDKIYKLTY